MGFMNQQFVLFFISRKPSFLIFFFIQHKMSFFSFFFNPCFNSAHSILCLGQLACYDTHNSVIWNWSTQHTVNTHQDLEHCTLHHGYGCMCAKLPTSSNDNDNDNDFIFSGPLRHREHIYT